MNSIGIVLGIRYELHQLGSVGGFLMGLAWCISEAVGRWLRSDGEPVLRLCSRQGVICPWRIVCYSDLCHFQIIPQEERVVFQDKMILP